MELTSKINHDSIEYIKNSIQKKISDKPYFANKNSVMKVVTDMDHHPYHRWYRGVYYFPEPVVMEREAGWRKIQNDCYDLVIQRETEKEPNHCFEAPCSTTFPCYPEYLVKYADKDALDVMINKACISQYR
jgi:hypothetical protein